MPHSRPASAFSIDLRSLALFRMALGLILLADLALRWPLWRECYTEAGPWPAAAALAELPTYCRFLSLHTLSTHPAWTASLFALEAIFAALLVVGWRTRLATIVSWLLLISLHARNGMLQNGGDLELRLLLFWGAWLPLGARWSLDARRAPRLLADRVLSGASAALLLQVALIYVTSSLLKTDPVWWQTGDAVRQALLVETYVLPLGRWLRDWPTLLQVATFGTLLLEGLGPFVAFSPWKRDRCRTVAALAFIGFHAMLALTLRLGTFPFVGMAGWLPFLPGSLWPRKDEQHESLRAPLPVNALVLSLVALACLCSLRPWFGDAIPVGLRKVAVALRIDQRWDLFAPRPLDHETWYVVVGFYGAEGEVDLLTGNAPSWTEPPALATRYPNNRWRRYIMALHEKQHPERARHYVEWVRRNFEQTHPGHPVLVQITAYRVLVSILDRSKITQQEVYVWPESLKDASTAPPLAEPPGNL